MIHHYSRQTYQLGEKQTFAETISPGALSSAMLWKLASTNELSPCCILALTHVPLQITKGLLAKYGPDRVKDTPITEAGSFPRIACSHAHLRHQTYCLPQLMQNLPNFADWLHRHRLRCCHGGSEANCGVHDLQLLSAGMLDWAGTVESSPAVSSVAFASTRLQNTFTNELNLGIREHP